MHQSKQNINLKSEAATEKYAELDSMIMIDIRVNTSVMLLSCSYTEAGKSESRSCSSVFISVVD